VIFLLLVFDLRRKIFLVTFFISVKMWRPWVCDDGEASCSNSFKRKHLSTDAKQIISNVYQTLLKRNFNSSDALAETSDLTNTPLSSVKDIVLKPITPRKKRKDSGTLRSVDESDVDLIRRKVYEMYEEQSVPTLISLKSRLIDDQTNISCSISSLRKILLTMGFKYHTIDKRQVVMESQRLREWRHKYLTGIRQYRAENRPIIYLDETWFDTHDTAKKGWDDCSKKCQTKAPSNKGKRITIIHAGSENGFVPNCLLLSAKNIADSSLDYHQDTDAQLFEDWFEHRLLQNIPKNSVIVMDNASYHSRQVKLLPSSSSTKAEIQNFMIDNNIYFNETYKKRDLLEVLQAFKISKEYVCDKLATEKGHVVLRLPPYYCVFNPIELIWHQVKANVRRNNTSPTLNASVIELTKNIVSSISADSWKNCIHHVVKVENSYMSLSSNVTPLIISLDEDSDSDTELNVE
jgi:transposase